MPACQLVAPKDRVFDGGLHGLIEAVLRRTGLWVVYPTGWCCSVRARTERVPFR
jgi:hypothetical protein